MKTINPKKQMVSIKTPLALEFINPDEILYCMIQGDDVTIKLQSGQTITYKQSLKTLEKEFTAYPYFRCHARYLVNLSHIKRYIHKTGQLLLTDNTSLSVAKARRPNFKKIIDDL